MKRIMQHFRAWCVAAGLLSVVSGATGQSFTFTTNNGAITITGAYGASGTWVIPAMINGYPVTSIAGGAFSAHSMTNVIIPNTVTNIGSYAFQNCPTLKSITLPDSLITMGFAVFGSCTGLTNAVIGGGLTTIPLQTFQGCTSLTNVVISEGVRFIDQEAFENTGLFQVNIPDSVTNIAFYAFDNSLNLTNVVVGSGVMTMGVKSFDNYHSKPVTFYFKGSPPVLGGAPVTQAYVYYLPGATGWGTNFGGFTATLWNPQALTDDGQFGVRNGRFGFTITGTTNIPIVVDLSTNLAKGRWTLMQSLLLTNGSYYFSDAFARTNGPAGRFYRIRSP